jgi:hypothetical protein
MMPGGWDFVAWAYGIAYGALACYSLALWRRIDADTDADAAVPPHDEHHDGGP